MHELTGLTGCGTALVTPFRSDGALDVGTLDRLVDRQLEAGIDFLVPCGTTGEGATLSPEEQLRVVETVQRRAGGRVPVVAGAGGNDTARVIEIARRMEGLGVSGLLSVTPYYNKPTQEGLWRHYAEIARAVEIPILLYNVPGRTAVNLLPETVLRLAEVEGIVGIKEASGDIVQISRLAAAMPEGFRLLSGDDGNVLPLVALGGCGVISVVSNLAPALMTAFTRDCLRGDFAAARRALPTVLELTAACFIETNPVPAKAALAMMGELEEVYRLPLAPMTPANRERLRRALGEIGLFALS